MQERNQILPSPFGGCAAEHAHRGLLLPSQRGTCYALPPRAPTNHIVNVEGRERTSKEHSKTR